MNVIIVDISLLRDSIEKTLILSCAFTTQHFTYYGFGVVV